MKLIDRFVCRREGHVPTLRFAPTPFVTSAYCTCSRCGKWIEVKADNTMAPVAGLPQDLRDRSQKGA